MKLSFSTLGCPGWSWSVITSSAKDIGMDGVEVRCIGNELYAPKCVEFRGDNAIKTVEGLRKSGLCIPCLDSNAVLAVPSKAEDAVSEAIDYIDLAARIGTPYVRVMCVGVPEPCDCDLDLCTELYTKLCKYGEDKMVTPLLETNGPLGDSAVITDLMSKVDSDSKGILWDVHHPYRYFGETPEQTYNNIAPLLRHVHIKDSVMEDGRVVYRMMGKGDIPVKQTMLMLLEKGYDGFVSLEWVKKWQPDLEEAGVVFPNFASYAKRVIGSFDKR